MKYLYFLAVISIYFSACATPNHIIKPQNLKTHVKGLYIEINTASSSQIGEIISVDENEIKILTTTDDHKLITYSKSQILTADLIVAGTSNNPKDISRWGGLLPLFSLTHGAIGIITLPGNLLTSLLIGLDASKGSYRMKYPDQLFWVQLSKYARFPQGIPQAVNEKLIR